MSKATKFNRQMMSGMAVFAIILLACVFSMLYFSFQNVEDKHVVKNLYSIRFAPGLTDSMEVVVNDSVLFTGTVSDTLMVSGDGIAGQNMLSVSDLTSGETFNIDLPMEPTMAMVSKDDKLKVETTKMMAPVQ